MKYQDGRKYRRSLGASRKDKNIYANLGHPYDIKGKKVIYLGDEGENVRIHNKN